MSTMIYFGAGGEQSLSVRVNEDPNEVFQKLNEAHGQPFALTPASGEGPVYVNPATIAYWKLHGKGRVHFG